jgi:hypothetical protein
VFANPKTKICKAKTENKNLQSENRIRKSVYATRDSKICIVKVGIENLESNSRKAKSENANTESKICAAIPIIATRRKQFPATGT